MNTDGRGLSYEAAPAYSTPLRFFLTAPAFGVAAGLLLLASPELLASRWTPGALALTHLIAAGFMLSVMFGALFQILPVVAGASIPYNGPIATVSHLTLTAGAAALSWGLGAKAPDALFTGAAMLGVTFAAFLCAAVWGLRRAPVAQATPRDLRLALAGLGVALLLGFALALVLSRGVALPLLTVLQLHVGWAWLGGVGLLLAATSWVVVPMFQITPNYPAPMTRFWGYATCAALALWSAALLSGHTGVALALLLALLALGAAYALTTLYVQSRSRRTTPDPTYRIFQFGMGAFLAGLACVLGAQLSDDARLPLLAGVLVLHGGFVSVIQGMLYKIVPFLAWLHLTQEGIKAPNMKKLQPDAPVRRQLVVHMAASAALLLATLTEHALLGRLAGALLVVEFALLLANIINVVRAYRRALSA